MSAAGDSVSPCSPAVQPTGSDGDEGSCPSRLDSASPEPRSHLQQAGALGSPPPQKQLGSPISSGMFASSSSLKSSAAGGHPSHRRHYSRSLQILEGHPILPSCCEGGRGSQSANGSACWLAAGDGFPHVATYGAKGPNPAHTVTTLHRSYTAPTHHWSQLPPTSQEHPLQMAAAAADDSFACAPTAPAGLAPAGRAGSGTSLESTSLGISGFNSWPQVGSSGGHHLQVHRTAATSAVPAHASICHTTALQQQASGATGSLTPAAGYTFDLQQLPSPWNLQQQQPQPQHQAVLQGSGARCGELQVPPLVSHLSAPADLAGGRVWPKDDQGRLLSPAAYEMLLSEQRRHHQHRQRQLVRRWSTPAQLEKDPLPEQQQQLQQQLERDGVVMAALGRAEVMGPPRDAAHQLYLPEAAAGSLQLCSAVTASLLRPAAALSHLIATAGEQGGHAPMYSQRSEAPVGALGRTAGGDGAATLAMTHGDGQGAAGGHVGDCFVEDPGRDMSMPEWYSSGPQDTCGPELAPGGRIGSTTHRSHSTPPAPADTAVAAPAGQLKHQPASSLLPQFGAASGSGRYGSSSSLRSLPRASSCQWPPDRCTVNFTVSDRVPPPRSQTVPAQLAAAGRSSSGQPTPAGGVEAAAHSCMAARQGMLHGAPWQHQQHPPPNWPVGHTPCSRRQQRLTAAVLAAADPTPAGRSLHSHGCHPQHQHNLRACGEPSLCICSECAQLARPSVRPQRRGAAYRADGETRRYTAGHYRRGVWPPGSVPPTYGPGQLANGPAAMPGIATPALAAAGCQHSGAWPAAWAQAVECPPPAAAVGVKRPYTAVEELPDCHHLRARWSSSSSAVTPAAAGQADPHPTYQQPCSTGRSRGGEWPRQHWQLEQGLPMHPGKLPHGDAHNRSSGGAVGPAAECGQSILAEQHLHAAASGPSTAAGLPRNAGWNAAPAERMPPAHWALRPDRAAVKGQPLPPSAWMTPGRDSAAPWTPQGCDTAASWGHPGHPAQQQYTLYDHHQQQHYYCAPPSAGSMCGRTAAGGAVGRQGFQVIPHGTTGPAVHPAGLRAANPVAAASALLCQLPSSSHRMQPGVNQPVSTGDPSSDYLVPPGDNPNLMAALPGASPHDTKLMGDAVCGVGASSSGKVSSDDFGVVPTISFEELLAGNDSKQVLDVGDLDLDLWCQLDQGGDKGDMDALIQGWDFGLLSDNE